MAKVGEDINTLEIPVSVPSAPFAPWLRVALLDDWRRVGTVAMYIDDFLFHLQLEGTSWVWLEQLGGTIDVVPGDLIFCPPNLTMAWHYGPEVHLAVHFDLHAKPELIPFYNLHPVTRHVRHRPSSKMPVFVLRLQGSPQRGELRIPMVTHLREPEVWRDRFETLIRLHQTHTETSIDARCIVNETIMWALTSLHRSGQIDRWSRSQIDPALDALLSEMKDPRTRKDLQKLSVEQIARGVGRGLTSFRQAFKEATGSSPHQYMLERQMEQAAHMLVDTNSRVKEVALAVGYDDQYHFSRVFRRVIGTAPSHYRRQYLTPKHPKHPEDPQS